MLPDASLASDTPITSLLEHVLWTWAAAYLGYRALMKIVGGTK